MFSQTSIVQLDLSNNKLKKEGAMHLAKAIQNFKTPGREGLSLILENTQLGGIESKQIIELILFS